MINNYYDEIKNELITNEVYKKVKEEELLEALRYELLHWSE